MSYLCYDKTSKKDKSRGAGRGTTSWRLRGDPLAFSAGAVRFGYAPI